MPKPISQLISSLRADVEGAFSLLDDARIKPRKVRSPITRHPAILREFERSSQLPLSRCNQIRGQLICRMA